MPDDDAREQVVDTDDVESPITDVDIDDDDTGNDDEVDSVTADVSESEPNEGESDEHDGHEANESKLALFHNQFEFKRSADFATVPGDKEQLNNYTNFSRITRWVNRLNVK